MQLSILASILQSRVRYAAQSRVLGQVQQQQQINSVRYNNNTRSGVEDTRLEAKAKNTKKIRGQGQGQPFRGQTLSRPRTGMLEAKDQGHKRKCSPKKKKKKKKGFHKNFSGDLHKITFSKKFFKRSTKF